MGLPSKKSLMSVALRLSSASLTVALMRGLRVWIFELGAGLKLMIVGALLLPGGLPGGGGCVAFGSDCQVGFSSGAGLSVIWLALVPPVELMVQMSLLPPTVSLWKAILVPSG